MFEDLSGHHTTGEHGTCATNTKSGVAPSFLTVPVLSNQIAPVLHLLADADLFAARMRLFRDSGLLHDGCLAEVSSIYELSALADQQLAKSLAIENQSTLLELHITLGREVTSSYCGFREESNPYKDGSFEIGITLSINRRTNVLYLKDKMQQLENACPGMENFVARTFKNMDGWPWILNPFAVQESFSPYIFDWHIVVEEEACLNGEGGGDDFLTSTRHPSILKSIPNIWRSKSIARYWERQLDLVLLETGITRKKAIQRQVDPTLEKIRLLGNAIARDNPRLTKILKKYPHCRGFESSNWLMVIAYEQSDFIQQHADEVYEQMQNGGEAEDLGFAVQAPKDPKKFIELIRDLKFILTYIDRCVCFCDLVTTE